MRNSKVVELDDKRKVTLRELRVQDVRNALAEEEKLKALDFSSLIKDETQLADLMNLLGDCVELSPEAMVADLSFSELEEIGGAFRELNAPFFRMLGLIGIILPGAAQPTSASSTAPAAS